MTSFKEQLAEFQQDRKLLREEVTDEDIAEIVSRWTRIPVSRMLESEKQKLLHMDENLHSRVIGQDEALKYVSVAIFKHIWGEAVGNVLMIGNSGTGKTTIMRAIEHFYSANPSLRQFRVVVRMNANTLSHEEGQVITGKQLLKTLQDRAVQILGKQATLESVKDLIEHATVCIDEVDKVSTIVGGKSNPISLAL